MMIEANPHRSNLLTLFDRLAAIGRAVQRARKTVATSTTLARENAATADITPTKAGERGQE